MEEVPLDEVQPLTLEELESIRQEAWNEGFATGEKEGFHSTQLKVRQEAEVVLAAKVASLEQLMSNLLTPIAEQDTQIEKAVIHLVEHIARQVIQRELVTDSAQIASVLRDALKLLPMGAQNVRIFINPQDFLLVKAMRERHEESGRSSKMKTCCQVVVGSKPNIAVSTPASKRASPWQFPRCTTSCMSR